MIDLPIRHVLYSHYAAHEDEDHKAFSEGTPPGKLRVVQHLEAHRRGLAELLGTPGYEGILVLFYAPGFAEFLTGIAHGKSDEQLLQENESLRFAAAVARCVRGLLERAQLAQRVRFITALDLKVILGQAHTILAEKFRRYFVGPARGIRYDTPKIVEAILRLRLLGNGVPVLRLDHDVLFRFSGSAKVIGDLGLFKAVACATRAYHLRLADPTVSTFIFSASYNTRDLKDRSPQMDLFEAWSRAFATRVYPALVADPIAIGDVFAQPSEQHDNAWNTYLQEHLDEPLVKRFFGIRESESNLEPDGTNGLTAIGAHPFYAVVSGALFCLSEGAILDLPPFSNFRNNVMWIDDHLKYSLHRALHHFTSGETLNLEPGLSDARLDDVTVTKARPSISKLPLYVFGNYLPTLLWGTIMDSWITVDPILKCRVAPLDPVRKDRWRDARMSEQEAPLPSAMLKALRIGHFELDAEDELREKLRSSAIGRVEKVRQMWASLNRDGKATFAAHWAAATVKSDFPAACFEGCPHHLWEGIAPGRAISEPIASLDDLSTSIAQKINELCDDTVTYVHWTLDWPKFVQIVRSVPQGTFTGDLSWVADYRDSE